MWLFILGSSLLPVGAASAATAQRVGPETGYPKAQCLDGSPGLYYFEPGSDDGVSKFFIFHQGGGFCQSDDSCLDRSSGTLGSTKSDSDEKDLESLGNLKFSRDAAKNPLMYNWNHVYFRYCDGGYYSGQREEPKVVQQTSLFYRGRYITEAFFSDLSRFGFANASDVVIGGCSAGAIRVYAHLDALRALAPSNARVAGLADSGYYMDVSMFTPLKRYVVTEHNGTGLLNQECVQNFPGAEEKCLIGSVISSYLKTPLFAFQSRFDADQQGCEMSHLCRWTAACVKEYAGNLSNSLEKTLQSPHGYFLDSCVRHCSFDDLAPQDVSGESPLRAFATWYAGGQAQYTQKFTYPCSYCCNTGPPAYTV